MKKSIIVPALALSLLALAAFSPSLATAQEPTPTATITSPPPLQISTPVSGEFDEGNDCPEDGNITGFGTVTPSAFWEYSCSHCLVTPESTSTPAPVPTWDGTGTPPPTTTPTIDVTPTSQPQAGGYITEYTMVGYVQPNSWCLTNTLNSTVCTLSPDGSVLSCSVDMQAYDSASSDTLGRSCEAGIQVSFLRSQDELYVYWEDDITFTPTQSQNVMYANYQNYDLSSGELLITQGGIATIRAYSSGLYTGFLRVVGTLTISTSPIGIPPTPTPNPDAEFCSSVAPLNDEEYFGFTGVEFGQMACVDFLDPPINKEILGVEINIPHFIHLCFQDVSIGVITLFGMSFSLDTIVAVGVAIWALRNLFIS
jgi:hypothetical protein